MPLQLDKPPHLPRGARELIHPDFLGHSRTYQRYSSGHDGTRNLSWTHAFLSFHLLDNDRTHAVAVLTIGSSSLNRSSTGLHRCWHIASFGATGTTKRHAVIKFGSATPTKGCLSLASSFGAAGATKGCSLFDFAVTLQALSHRPPQVRSTRPNCSSADHPWLSELVTHV